MFEVQAFNFDGILCQRAADEMKDSNGREL